MIGERRPEPCLSAKLLPVLHPPAQPTTLSPARPPAGGTAQRSRRRRPADSNHLPQALYHAAHLDPSLLSNPAVAEAFLPTPWLLPEAGVWGWEGAMPGGPARCPLLVPRVQLAYPARQHPQRSPSCLITTHTRLPEHLRTHTPWPLPAPAGAAQQHLDYVGLHNDMDALLRVRAMPVPSALNASARAVSLVYFSHSHAVLMQNWVYTAVKWVVCVCVCACVW